MKKLSEVVLEELRLLTKTVVDTEKLKWFPLREDFHDKVVNQMEVLLPKLLGTPEYTELQSLHNRFVKCF